MRKDRSMLEWMGTYYKLLSNKYAPASSHAYKR
jgi:hypothetical protein